MKRMLPNVIKIMVLLMAVITNEKAYAVLDTLRHYSPARSLRGVPSTTYFEQYARFDLKAPGYINTIIVTLGGVTTGSVTVHVYGHEGGTSFPQLEKDLVGAIKFNKTAKGTERVAVNLPKPLWVDNDQVFLKVGNFSSNTILLMADNQVHPPACSSADGGDYYYSLLRDANGLYTGDNAYAIDLVIDYPGSLTSSQYFKNIATASGIGSNTYAKGICWGDFNGDHNLDVLVGGKLFKNNGNSTFTDVTTSAGITTKPYIYTFIDINNDGKEDIVFLNDNAHADDWLYLNNGNGTFTKSALNLSPRPALVNVNSIGIADVNNDKYPDLWISQHENPSTLGTSYPHYLLMNDRNNGFVDSSGELYPANYTFSPTYASMFTDFNNDNQLDLYLANYRLLRDELWQNNGNGTFTNVVGSKAIDINSKGGANHGTGVDWADYDNDGDMDMLLSQLAHPQFALQDDHRPTTIYRNDGAPNFNFTDLNPGIEKGTIGIQYEEMHAGSAWGDLNSDGLADFMTTSFYGCRHADVYMQNTDHTFSLKSFDFGIQDLVTSSDATLVDFNNDGRLDMCVGNNTNFNLYQNTLTSANNYTAIDLVSTSGNHFGIGAKVVVYAGGNQYTQYQVPFHGSSMGKGNRLFFGLGQAAGIDSVVVRWPNGTLNTEKFLGVRINTYNILTEGGQVESNGVKEKYKNVNITVYPNPAADVLHINAPMQVNVMIKGIDGRSMLQVHDARDIDISSLTNGMYVLYITGCDGVPIRTEKFVKLK